MGSSAVGSVLGTVLGVGSSIYSAKKQSDIQKRQIDASNKATAAQVEIANKQLAETKRQNDINTATNALEKERENEVTQKRRNSIFQTSNYGNENFGTGILG